MKYEVTEAAIEAAQETAISQFGLMLDDDHASAIISAALPHLTGWREIDDDAIHEEMLRRMDLPRYVDQEINPDWLPIDETQIGVEFAIEYLRNLPTSAGGQAMTNAVKILTYKNQPDNVGAWRLGVACSAAIAELKVGDPIDRGLVLLRELEAKGFGVVKLEVKP